MQSTALRNEDTHVDRKEKQNAIGVFQKCTEFKIQLKYLIQMEITDTVFSLILF